MVWLHIRVSDGLTYEVGEAVLGRLPCGPLVFIGVAVDFHEEVAFCCLCHEIRKALFNEVWM